PLDAGVPPDRHQAAALTAHPPPAQPEVNDRADVILTKLVLSDPHRPDNDAGLRLTHHPGELEHFLPGRAAEPFQLLPGLTLQRRPQVVETRGVLVDEFLVDAASLDHPLLGTIEKGDIA